MDIYSGIFTPTEAISVAVVYAFIIGWFAYKELTFEGIVHCLKVTAMISGAVLIILGPAKSFGELMSLMSAPDLIEEGLTGITENAFLMLMIIAVILIITGHVYGVHCSNYTFNSIITSASPKSWCASDCFWYNYGYSL